MWRYDERIRREARMSRLAIALAVGLSVAWSVGLGATTVDHRWSGDAYVIRAYDIDDAPANGFLLSTFYVVNEGKWEIARDTVNDAIMFPTGAHSSLEDVEVEMTFKAYEELKLTLPARLIAEGDQIVVYVMWVDDKLPAATFVVEEGGPEPTEPGAAAPLANPFSPFTPIRMPLPLEIDAEYAADGSASATIRNPGTAIFRASLKVTATLSYFRDWIGESITRFLDHPLGRILLAPDAVLRLTVAPGASAEESYVITFLDLIEQGSGAPLAVSVLSPDERAIGAFREMIYNVWTGVSDKEPDTDYIDLGFGVPGLYILVPITPYFPPPR
jgi:hypothetical protein